MSDDIINFDNNSAVESSGYLFNCQGEIKFELNQNILKSKVI